MAKKNADPNFVLSREKELKAFRDMLLIRRFEERCGQMYVEGLIAGFCHLYIGQEAVVVGMQMTIGDGDQVITAYRDHGHALMSGMDPKQVLAELTGRIDGASKGKGGSMHIFARTKDFMAVTELSVLRSRSARAWHSRTNIAATSVSASLNSVTKRPTRGKSTRASIW